MENKGKEKNKKVIGIIVLLMLLASMIGTGYMVTRHLPSVWTIRILMRRHPIFSWVWIVMAVVVVIQIVRVV